MSIRLELIEKTKTDIYYYGDKIDIINDFYLSYNNNFKILKNISIDKIPISILCLITTNNDDSNERHLERPKINISYDPYNIYLDKIGNYKMTMTFTPIKINNIIYNIECFTKDFDVVKKKIKMVYNNYYIKHLMYINDNIPLYVTNDNIFDILYPENNTINWNIIKKKNLFNYATFCILDSKLKKISTGSQDNKSYRITNNENIYICLEFYDCYCYDFDIDKFEINVKWRPSYIKLKKDFLLKVGNSLIITEKDYEMYDIYNNKIDNAKFDIYMCENDNLKSSAKMIPFLDSGIYYIKLVSDEIMSDKSLLIITKYETKIVNNLETTYTQNTILKIKDYVYVIDENNNKHNISSIMINNKMIDNEYKFTICGPCIINVKFNGCRLLDFCDKNINIYIEPIHVTVKFNHNNYILLNNEKYIFSLNDELVYDKNKIDNNFGFIFKREEYDTNVETNFTIDFKNPEINRPITDTLGNYTVIADKIHFLAEKYFNGDNFINLITKISIVLSIELYMTCFYEDNGEIKEITVNSEIWFEQLEKRYDGISGLSYDYFLVASVVNDSVIGFSLNNIFIPFIKILYIEIGKLCEYDDLIYIPQSYYKVNIINNSEYNIESSEINLYLINYLNQIEFNINNGDPLEAIHGTAINLRDYNIEAYANYNNKKYQIDISVFEIVTEIDYNNLNEGTNNTTIIFYYRHRNYYWSVPIIINLSFPTIYVNIESWKNNKIINDNLNKYGTYFSATFGPNTEIINELKITNQLPKYPYINSNLPLMNFDIITIVPILSIPDYSYADRTLQISKYSIMLNDAPYDDNCHMAEFITNIYIKPYVIPITFDDIVVGDDNDIYFDNNIIIRTKQDNNEQITINTASIINKFIYNPNGHNFKADITFKFTNDTNITDHEFFITDTAENNIYVKNIGEKCYKSNTFIYNIHGYYPTIKFPKIINMYKISEINIRQFSKFQ